MFHFRNISSCGLFFSFQTLMIYGFWLEEFRSVFVCVCRRVCVCVWERERERERMVWGVECHWYFLGEREIIFLAIRLHLYKLPQGDTKAKRSWSLEFKEVLLSPEAGRSIDLCLQPWLGSAILGPNNDKSHQQLNSSSIVYKVPLFASFFLSFCFFFLIFIEV